MKTSVRTLTTLLSLAALPFAARAADEAKAEIKTEKKELRVLAAPDREGARTNVKVISPRGVFQWQGQAGEKETVTFLGVVTSTVSATLSAQLGLAAGSGLVIQQVEADTPAAAVLKEHDILLKLDDQLLVEQRQLSILIRQHKEGDEITLTYLRAGKQATAKVKLAKHEVPKISVLFDQAATAPGGFAYAFGGDGKFELATPAPDGSDREHLDRVMALIARGRGAPDSGPGTMPGTTQLFVDRGGPGFRAMSINSGNSSLSFSDDNGSLDLTIQDGRKTLVAKNTKGEQVFSGPVTTPEERKAMPEAVRERLEKLEGMRDVTFRTDGDFKGAETRLLQPRPRGISLPQPAPAPLRPPLFF